MTTRDTTTPETGLKSPGLASPPPMSAGTQAAPDDDRAVGISAWWIRSSIDMLEEERFNYSILPLKDAIDAYVRDGVPRGSFLTALLCGDYRDALALADQTNRWLLPIYAAYLYNEVPGNAHGSAENVRAHIERCRAKAGAR